MIRKLFRWFIANTLLPILAPVLFLCTISWFKDGSFPFVEVFLDLVKNGFYVFSALSLIFSLLEDYPNLKMSGMGPVQGAFNMLLVIMTLYVFLLIQTKDSQYVSSHALQFAVIWILTALSAFYAKFNLLKYKSNNGLL
jgi:hypothetical protein